MTRRARHTPRRTRLRLWSSPRATLSRSAMTMQSASRPKVSTVNAGRENTASLRVAMLKVRTTVSSAWKVSRLKGSPSTKRNS